VERRVEHDADDRPRPWGWRCCGAIAGPVREKPKPGRKAKAKSQEENPGDLRKKAKAMES